MSVSCPSIAHPAWCYSRREGRVGVTEGVCCLRAPSPYNSGRMKDASEASTSRCLEHVRHLSERIGPRGSTTAQEREAAEYAGSVLERLGLDVAVQRFRSAVSAWRPYALALALALLALAVYPIGGRVTAVIAAIIMITVFVSAFLELNFVSNPLRWVLPKGWSQNIWAVIPPRGQPRRKVVLVGHLDTHRTPFVFRSARHLKIFALLSPLGFGGMLTLFALFVIGAIVQAEWVHVAAVIVGLGLAVLLMILVQADFTPYTHGANDNASGAAIVLALAERLVRQPLNESEVWALNTGCEEVGCYGADAFLREHRAQLQDAYFIVFDSVGGPGTGPCFITREGMTRRYRPDPRLLSLARFLAVARPELGAYEMPMRLGYTEGAIGIKRGLRTITFVSLGRKDGILPLWHQVQDRVDKIDADTLARTEQFAWELLQRIDAGEA